MNPFDTAPTIGRIVHYHHSDGHDYPAIVSDRRARDTAGFYVAQDASRELIEHADESAGPLTIQLNLTVFRPGKIEWHWCAESETEGGWSWPERKAS